MTQQITFGQPGLEGFWDVFTGAFSTAWEGVSSVFGSDDDERRHRDGRIPAQRLQPATVARRSMRGLGGLTEGVREQLAHELASYNWSYGYEVNGCAALLRTVADDGDRVDIVQRAVAIGADPVIAQPCLASVNREIAAATARPPWWKNPAWWIAGGAVVLGASVAIYALRER